MSLLKLLDKIININNKNKEKNYTEEELDIYGLSKEEKDLVRKGLYNPWDFEDDGKLGDDDYYNEKQLFY